jgi:hypothetical protein
LAGFPKADLCAQRSVFINATTAKRDIDAVRFHSLDASFEYFHISCSRHQTLPMTGGKTVIRLEATCHGAVQTMWHSATCFPEHWIKGELGD